MWSDAARKAALEARRRRGSSRKLKATFGHPHPVFGYGDMGKRQGDVAKLVTSSNGVFGMAADKDRENADAVLYRSLRKHPMYSKSDLDYLTKKGYRPHEIKAFWDRDHKAGASPVHHVKKPDVVGFLSRGMKKRQVTGTMLNYYGTPRSYPRGVGAPLTGRQMLFKKK